MANPQLTLCSMGKNWKHFPNIRNKTEMSAFITLIQNSSSQKRRSSKRHPNWKERKLIFCWWHNTLFFLKDFIYLFIFRERGREEERRKETSMCSCLLWAPYWGPGPQSRHVSGLGIEPVTLWFTIWHSIYWATTPARVDDMILYIENLEDSTKKLLQQLIKEFSKVADTKEVFRNWLHFSITIMNYQKGKLRKQFYLQRNKF